MRRFFFLLTALACLAANVDPGRVTARRLNRAEYNNTIRDLLGVDFRPADDFPADDSGYGFDNNGDVLSLSPVLMEQYLAAAERIARAAIAADPLPKPTIERSHTEAFRKVFPFEADYEVRISVRGAHNPMKLTLRMDESELKVFDIGTNRDKPRVSEIRIHLSRGEHALRAELTADGARAETAPARVEHEQRPPFIDSIEFRGPFDPVAPPLPESHKRIFICGHEAGQHQPECARRIVAELARRAYRRPVTDSEVNGLVRFIGMAQAQGDSFEQGVRVALEAMLVSPHFLFRIERDRSMSAHQIGEYELASRLSYFLWSSMPDEELFRHAADRSLQRPEILEAQVGRMLRDPKSDALVDNFAGQWLQIRNLDTVKPDPDKFPAFDGELRDAMRTETRLFLKAVIQEDRSILDLIDGRFTFLNERLARFYGIPGVEGSEFRRVSLDGVQRAGVLTQASILTVSSYPARTSPVLRGKYILDNFLNAPPPPPPPGVANLDENAVGNTGSMRQQLEKHRSNPACAACHARMDPLGFGLENYDAIGQWRAQDGKFPVDATGTLPNGASFRTPAELRDILKADREAFSQCLTRKLLTYALGRGLETYDKAAVNSICGRLAANDYRFSSLVTEIAESAPFQMRRGDAKP